MSGTNKQKTYYWDACIYLAWLQNETVHGKNHADAIKYVAQQNKERKNIIISSTIVFIEVLAAKLSAENELLFRQCFRNQWHIAYDVDPPTALKARDFREKLLNHESGKTLSTPDAIHLATASINKPDELWTFDDGKKDKKHLGLLELAKDSRVDRLNICKPDIDQPILI